MTKWHRLSRRDGSSLSLQLGKRKNSRARAGKGSLFRLGRAQLLEELTFGVAQEVVLELVLGLPARLRFRRIAREANNLVAERFEIGSRVAVIARLSGAA